MAITKVLAREWKVEISDGGTTPVFTEIKGINSLTFSSDKSDVDVTDFASNGFTESMVASRSYSFSAEGFYLVDRTTGDRDPGQKAVEDLGAKISADSVGAFRLTSPGGVVKTFNATVGLSDVGGGNDDAASWGFELTVSGPITTVETP